MNTESVSKKQKGNAVLHGVSRSAFRQLQIPILPYCEVKTSYSTDNFDSFHIKNLNTNCQLNVFWRSDNTVSVGFYDSKIKKLRDRNKEVFNTSKNFNNKILAELCSEFLC